MENLIWVIWASNKESVKDWFTVTVDDGRSMKAPGGSHLVGYQVKGSKPSLFWGVGTGTITHAGGKFRAKYGNETITDFGTRGPAASWWGSWTKNEGTENVDIHGSIAPGMGSLIIGIYGCEGIKKLPQGDVEHWEQDFDLLLLTISPDGKISSSDYLFKRTCGKVPNEPIFWTVQDDRGLGKYCNPDLY